MRRPFVTRVAVGMTGALLVLAAGCARRAPKPSPEAMPADARAAIGEWMTLVSRALPGTTVDSLVFAGRGRMPIAYRRAAGDDSGGADPRHDPEIEWAPGGDHWLDPNMYRDVSPGSTQPDYDADSAPVLGDARDGTAAVLVVTGPSCRHEDARWLDAARFLLLAAIEVEPSDVRPGRWFRWEIALHDLRDSSIVTWVTRDASDEGSFRRYSDAVDSFVVARVAARREALARQ